MVDGVDAMKKERDAAVRELKKAALEAKQYKECLEGGWFVCACYDDYDDADML